MRDEGVTTEHLEIGNRYLSDSLNLLKSQNVPSILGEI